ncbi:hypothetical protein ACU4HD_31810 [Cupriavidus basilensis]
MFRRTDQIRATVLAMLTEAGDAAPLSRTLNAIEAEVVRLRREAQQTI